MTNVRRISLDPTILWVLALAVLSLAVYGSYYDRGLLLADEGTLIHATQRILSGDVPYRDFYHFYAPGRFYLLAGLFKLFGERFLVSRMMWVVVRTLNVLLVFLVAGRFMPRPYALWPALFTLLVPGPWFKSFYGFATMFSLWLTLRYAKRPGAPRAALAGLGVGAAALLRQDVGAAAALLLAVALAAAPFGQAAEHRRWRRVPVHAGVALAAVAVVIAPVLVYFHGRGALGPMARQLFGLAPGYTLSKWKVMFTKFQHFERDLVQGMMFAVPPVVLAVGGVVWLVRLARRRVALPEIRLLLLLGMAGMTLVPAYVPMAAIRLYQCGLPAWVLTAWLVWAAADGLGAALGRAPAAGKPREGAQHVAAAAMRRHLPAPRPQWVRPAAAIAGFLLLSVTVSALVTNILTTKRAGLASSDYAGTLRTRFRNTQPFFFRGERIYLAPRRGRHLKRLVQYVRRHTRPQEPIIVFPNQALLYYLCDRPNATRFVGTFTLKYRDEIEDRAIWQEWVNAAQTVRPRYIIVSSKFMETATSHYFRRELKKYYTLEKQFGALIVMRRGEKKR